MTVVYGLRNCDTCRKALAWLRDEGVEFRFHDVRDDGLDSRRLEKWCNAVGWEVLLNRRGTTWRGLSEADRSDVHQARAIELMQRHPALVKRPVFEMGAAIVVGFGEGQKRRLLAQIVTGGSSSLDS